jgi:hypothetical protein
MLIQQSVLSHYLVCVNEISVMQLSAARFLLCDMHVALLVRRCQINGRPHLSEHPRVLIGGAIGGNFERWMNLEPRRS